MAIIREEVWSKALAEAESAWQGGPWGEDPPPAITAAASLFGLSRDGLQSYVEGELGWEPHDEGYGERVRQAAQEMTAGRRGD